VPPPRARIADRGRRFRAAGRSPHALQVQRAGGTARRGARARQVPVSHRQSGVQRQCGSGVERRPHEVIRDVLCAAGPSNPAFARPVRAVHGNAHRNAAPRSGLWDPGAVLGREFLYPKEQARRLAKTSSEPVLTTKAETTTVQRPARVTWSGSDRTVRRRRSIVTANQRRPVRPAHRSRARMRHPRSRCPRTAVPSGDVNDRVTAVRLRRLQRFSSQPPQASACADA
jgi:hypothetical protein